MPAATARPGNWNLLAERIGQHGRIDMNLGNIAMGFVRVKNSLAAKLDKHVKRGLLERGSWSRDRAVPNCDRADRFRCCRESDRCR